MSREDPQVNIRMPTHLLKALKASAAASGLSMTQELTRVLTSALPAKAPVQLRLRVPAEIYNALQGAAELSGRSLHDEAVARLADSTK